MNRPRDRASSAGLLPRMEARALKGGGFSYRYHPVGGKPVALGHDRVAACRKVLDMNGDASDRGAVSELWRLYRDTPGWHHLADATRADYTQCSLELLKVFGAMPAAAIRPSHINRYLRVERKAAPVRANREAALLSNLMNLAVERGDLDANPCKQIRRNKETPVKTAPTAEALSAFLAWARARGGQAVVLAGMAEFAALSGNRRCEFLDLSWAQIGPDAVRLARAKQRERETVEVLARSPALDALIDRMRAIAPDDRMGTVFHNRQGNPYTDAGFKAMWSKLINAAVEAGVIEVRFTFHALRAHYVTEHKAQRGALPDLHSNPATTARVYDRNREVKRRAL